MLPGLLLVACDCYFCNFLLVFGRRAAAGWISSGFSQNLKFAWGFEGIEPAEARLSKQPRSTKCCQENALRRSSCSHILSRPVTPCRRNCNAFPGHISPFAYSLHHRYPPTNNRHYRRCAARRGVARRNAAPSPFAAHLPAQTFRFTERTCRARAIPSSFRGTPRRAPIGVLKNVTLQRRRTEEGYLRAIHPVRGNKVRVRGIMCGHPIWPPGFPRASRPLGDDR